MKKLFDTLVYYANPLRPRREEGDGPRYVDINDRAMAAAIDVFLLYVVFFPVFLWIQDRLYRHIDIAALAHAREAMNKAQTAAELRATLPLLLASHQPQLWLLNTAVQILLIGVLLIGCQCVTRTTPGKYVLGLRIVNARTLEFPARWRYVLRYFAYLVSILPLMLGFIWISFNRERRGWHDYIAGTAVIHTRPRGWYWQQLKRGYRWVRGKLKSDNPRDIE